MTYSFIEAIERGYGTTYGGILNAMRSTISNSNSRSELLVSGTGGGLITSLLTMLIEGGTLGSRLKQVLSCETH